MRWTAVLTLSSWATFLVAQPWSGAPSSQALSTVCQRVVPVSGTLSFWSPEGKPKVYTCPDWSRLTNAEMNTLRAARNAVLRERVLLPRSSKPLPGGGPFYATTVISGMMEGDRLRLDTNAWLDDEPHCHAEERLLGIAKGISNMPGVDGMVTNRFQFTVVYPDRTAAAQERRFMKILSYDGGWHQVVIPVELLWAPGINDETLTFMILHEMGHVLGTPYPGDVYASECEADRWASEEGLAAFFGELRAQVARPIIADGLRQYYEHIYPPELVELSSCEPGGMDHYPSLECRLQRILDPIWVDSEGELVTECPDGCWQTCGTRQDRLIPSRDHSWSRGSCCDRPAPEEQCAFPFICTEMIRLESELAPFRFSTEVIEPWLCRMHPDLCSKDALLKRAAWKRHIPKLERQRSRVSDSLRRTLAQVKELRLVLDRERQKAKP